MVRSCPEMSSGKRFRASCMVIVEKPCEIPPLRMLALRAPSTRSQSTPRCRKKRLSSVTTNAAIAAGEI